MSSTCPESRNLALIGGVVFRAFHDPEKWEDTLMAEPVRPQSPRSKTPGPNRFHLGHHFPAGRLKAEQMDDAEWAGFVNASARLRGWGRRIRTTVAIRTHAAGFCDSRPELKNVY